MARRVKLSVAKKAVDSTLRRILNYTAEIIMSIILLVIICIPLAFVIPMWFQNVALGIPRTELALDPIQLVGYDSAVWLTLLLGLVSFVLAYGYILKLKPGSVDVDEPEEEVDEPVDDDEEEELEEEVVELTEEETSEEVAAEVVEEDETEEED